MYFMLYTVCCMLYVAGQALMRYVNHMAQHGIPAEMRLRRRGDRWRVLEDEDSLLPPVPNKQPASGIVTEGVMPSREKKQVLVFAFYAPWVTSAHVSAHKIKANQDRQLALKK